MAFLWNWNDATGDELEELVDKYLRSHVRTIPSSPPDMIKLLCAWMCKNVATSSVTAQHHSRTRTRRKQLIRIYALKIKLDCNFQKISTANEQVFTSLY
ncbi:hypothetical protein GZH46_00445 [Fragariocoptes setiger]|uniref:Uncharacterized protein n=1 Tax=Fragariocoptes setiger TaxID=1670756 RepID=A0ABQ7SC47_9ACAR|nr:hypothetical protein GZH46_00445 [Fragariocoptes setiger]